MLHKLRRGTNAAFNDGSMSLRAWARLKHISDSLCAVSVCLAVARAASPPINRRQTVCIQLCALGHRCRYSHPIIDASSPKKIKHIHLHCRKKGNAIWMDWLDQEEGRTGANLKRCFQTIYKHLISFCLETHQCHRVSACISVLTSLSS